MSDNTVSINNGGRWSNYINKFIGDWDYVASDIEQDYQGSCAIVGYRENWRGDQYAIAEWSYGSCSGCDGYEDMGEGERLQAFLRQIEFVDESTMLRMASNALATTQDGSYWRNGRKPMYERVVVFITAKRLERSLE